MRTLLILLALLVTEVALARVKCKMSDPAERTRWAELKEESGYLTHESRYWRVYIGKNDSLITGKNLQISVAESSQNPNFRRDHNISQIFTLPPGESFTGFYTAVFSYEHLNLECVNE